jgi:hypothetical protein
MNNSQSKAELKSGVIDLKFIRASKANGIAVVVSWECKHSTQAALNCLEHANTCDHPGLGETALCYLMAQGMESALVGDPKAASKTFVQGFRYNALGSMFSVSFYTKASATVLARVLSIIVSTMKPSKYMSKVASLMKSRGQSITTENKNHIEAHAVASIKKGITVFVAGNVKRFGNVKDKKTGAIKEADKIKLALDKVASKVPSLVEPSGKKEPCKLSEVKQCPLESPKSLSVSCSGLGVSYLFSYLHTKLGRDPEVEDGKLVIDKVTPTAVASMAKKDTISAYVTAKYGVLKDVMSEMTLYYSALSGLCDAASLGKAISGVTTSSIEKSISDSLASTK